MQLSAAAGLLVLQASLALASSAPSECQKTCLTYPTPPPPYNKAEAKGCSAMISFLLEADELVGSQAWSSQIQLMKHLVTLLGAAPLNYSSAQPWAYPSNYYALSYFSSKAKTMNVLPMGAWSRAQVVDAADKLRWNINLIGGQTNLAAGIQRALTDQTPTQMGPFRNQTPDYRFSVLMTQGFYDSGASPLAEATMLRQQVEGSGGRIYAVALGPRTNRAQLNAMTSGDPTDGSRVFSPGNAFFGIASHILAILRDAKCNMIPTICKCAPTGPPQP